jgi:tRNA-dihydrouridine synthase 2
MVRAVAEALTIPVIANGGSLDIKTFADLAPFQAATGCSSIMVARAAQWNMSVFRREGLLEPMEVIREYLRLAIRVENPFPNNKFNVLSSLHSVEKSDIYARSAKTNSMRELCALYDVECDEAMSARLQRGGGDDDDADGPSRAHGGGVAGDPASSDNKRARLRDTDHIVMDASFRPRDFPSAANPKVYLRQLAERHKLATPTYDTAVFDNGKRIQCTCTFGKKKFSSSWHAPNKRHAEQAVAAACLRALGLLTGLNDFKSDQEADDVIKELADICA